ncbi:MAG: HD domain-containing protein, partial [Candidatus Omnitrophota bacterium]
YGNTGWLGEGKYYNYQLRGLNTPYFGDVKFGSLQDTKGQDVKGKFIQLNLEGEGTQTGIIYHNKTDKGLSSAKGAVFANDKAYEMSLPVDIQNNLVYLNWQLPKEQQVIISNQLKRENNPLKTEKDNLALREEANRDLDSKNMDARYLTNLNFNLIGNNKAELSGNIWSVANFVTENGQPNPNWRAETYVEKNAIWNIGNGFTRKGIEGEKKSERVSYVEDKSIHYTDNLLFGQGTARFDINGKVSGDKLNLALRQNFKGQTLFINKNKDAIDALNRLKIDKDTSAYAIGILEGALLNKDNNIDFGFVDFGLVKSGGFRLLGTSAREAKQGPGLWKKIFLYETKGALGKGDILEWNKDKGWELNFRLSKDALTEDYGTVAEGKTFAIALAPQQGDKFSAYYNGIPHGDRVVFQDGLTGIKGKDNENIISWFDKDGKLHSMRLPVGESGSYQDILKKDINFDDKDGKIKSFNYGGKEWMFTKNGAVAREDILASQYDSLMQSDKVFADEAKARAKEAGLSVEQFRDWFIKNAGKDMDKGLGEYADTRQKEILIQQLRDIYQKTGNENVNVEKVGSDKAYNYYKDNYKKLEEELKGKLSTAGISLPIEDTNWGKTKNYLAAGNSGVLAIINLAGATLGSALVDPINRLFGGDDNYARDYFFNRADRLLRQREELLNGKIQASGGYLLGEALVWATLSLGAVRGTSVVKDIFSVSSKVMKSVVYLGLAGFVSGMVDLTLFTPASDLPQYSEAGNSESSTWRNFSRSLAGNFAVGILYATGFAEEAEVLEGKVKTFNFKYQEALDQVHVWAENNGGVVLGIPTQMLRAIPGFASFASNVFKDSGKFMAEFRGKEASWEYYVAPFYGIFRGSAKGAFGMLSYFSTIADAGLHSLESGINTGKFYQGYLADLAKKNILGNTLSNFLDPEGNANTITGRQEKRFEGLSYMFGNLLLVGRPGNVSEAIGLERTRTRIQETTPAISKIVSKTVDVYQAGIGTILAPMHLITVPYTTAKIAIKQGFSETSALRMEGISRGTVQALVANSFKQSLVAMVPTGSGRQKAAQWLGVPTGVFTVVNEGPITTERQSDLAGLSTKTQGLESISRSDVVIFSSNRWYQPFIHPIEYFSGRERVSYAKSIAEGLWNGSAPKGDKIAAVITESLNRIRVNEAKDIKNGVIGARKFDKRTPQIAGIYLGAQQMKVGKGGAIGAEVSSGKNDMELGAVYVDKELYKRKGETGEKRIIEVLVPTTRNNFDIIRNDSFYLRQFIRDNDTRIEIVRNNRNPLGEDSVVGKTADGKGTVHKYSGFEVDVYGNKDANYVLRIMDGTAYQWREAAFKNEFKEGQKGRVQFVIDPKVIEDTRAVKRVLADDPTTVMDEPGMEISAQIDKASIPQGVEKSVRALILLDRQVTSLYKNDRVALDNPRSTMSGWLGKVFSSRRLDYSEPDFYGLKNDVKTQEAIGTIFSRFTKETEGKRIAVSGLREAFDTIRQAEGKSESELSDTAILTNLIRGWANATAKAKTEHFYNKYDFKSDPKLVEEIFSGNYVLAAKRGDVMARTHIGDKYESIMLSLRAVREAKERPDQSEATADIFDSLSSQTLLSMSFAEALKGKYSGIGTDKVTAYSGTLSRTKPAFRELGMNRFDILSETPLLSRANESRFKLSSHENYAEAFKECIEIAKNKGATFKAFFVKNAEAGKVLVESLRAGLGKEYEGKIFFVEGIDKASAKDFADRVKNGEEAILVAQRDWTGSNFYARTDANTGKKGITVMVGADAITDGTQHLLRLAGEDKGRLDALEYRVILPKLMYGSDRIAESGLSEQNKRELSQLSRGSEAEARAIEEILHQLDGLSGKRSLDLAKGKTSGARVSVKVTYDSAEVKAIKEIFEGKSKDEKSKAILEGENQLKDTGRPDSYEPIKNAAKGVPEVALPNTIIRNGAQFILTGPVSYQEGVANNPINFWSYKEMVYYVGNDHALRVLLPSGATQEVKLADSATEISFQAPSGDSYNVAKAGGLFGGFVITSLNSDKQGQRVTLTGSYNVFAGKDGLRAQKGYLINVAGTNPLVIPASVMKGVKSVKTPNAYIVAQGLTGTSIADMKMQNIDLELIRSRSRMLNYLPYTLAALLGGKVKSVNALVSNIDAVTADAKAVRDIAFIERLLSVGNINDALKYGDDSLTEQTGLERYAKGVLDEADAQLRKERVINLGSESPAIKLAQELNYAEVTGNELSFNGNPYAYGVVTDLLQRMKKMYSFWVDPSIVEEAGIFLKQQVSKERENKGKEALGTLFNIADEELNTLVSKENIAYLNNLISLLDHKEEIAGLVTEDKGLPVNLVFPELRNDRDSGRAAYNPDSNNNSIDVSWMNVDGIGEISDRTFWEFDFWHESLDHPALDKTGILPLATGGRIRALSEVAAQYLSTRRVIERALTNNTLRNSKDLYNVVLNPLVGIKSGKQLRMPTEIIASRLYSRYAKIDPSLSINKEDEAVNVGATVEEAVPASPVKEDNIGSSPINGTSAKEQILVGALSALTGAKISVSSPVGAEEKYVDSIWSKMKIRMQMLGYSEGKALSTMEELYNYLKESHKADGLIDKGYHRFSHSVEVADLAFEAAAKKGYPYQAALEMAVAGLLHDYDSRQPYQAPKVANTIMKLRNDEKLNQVINKLGLDVEQIILMIRGTDFPMTEEQLNAIQGQLNAIKGKLLLKRTEEEIKLLALIDKSAAYIHSALTPKDSELRVRELAKEIGLPENDMIKGTPDFFKNFVDKDINSLVPILGKEYAQRWQTIKQYFSDIAASLGQSGSSPLGNMPSRESSSPIHNETMPLPVTATTAPVAVGSLINTNLIQQAIVPGSSPAIALQADQLAVFNQHAQILMNGIGVGSVTAHGPPAGAQKAQQISTIDVTVSNSLVSSLRRLADAQGVRSEG